MNKQYLIVLVVFFVFKANAQITFEKGYIVDNDNNKTECYIKNVDWRSSPENISYKVSQEAKTQEASISEIKEFYIYNTEHFYKKFDLLIDKSVLSDPDSKIRELNFDKEVAFLRVLVEGKGNLYEYPGNGIFFYDLNNTSIKQLEYKKYTSQQLIRKENNDYQKQLYNDLKCEVFSTERMLKVDYKRKDLIDLFADYNECQKSEFKLHQVNKTKTKVNFGVSFGINTTSLEVDYSVNTLQSSDDFGSQMVLSPGFEVEVLLPFNKNKWALFVAPNYQYYKESSRSVNLFSEDLGDLTFEYSYIEVPIGIRHYMYLNKSSKLFIQASYGIITHLSNNNDEPFVREDNIQGDIFFEQKSNKNSLFSLGFGVKFKEKYGLHFNYYFSKSITNNNDFSSNMDGSASLIATYNIF